MNDFLKKLYYSRVFWVGFGLAIGIGTTFIQQLYVFKVELQLRFFLLPAIAGGVVGVILQHAVWLQKRFREQLQLINTQDSQLKESERVLQFALHSGNAATWRFWPSKNLVEIGSHEFPFPLASGEFPENDFMESMEGDCRKDLISQLKEINENAFVDFEFQTKDLPGCWYRLSARLQGDIQSKEVVWVGVLIDITKAKHLEVNLKTEALAAKEASKAKSEFLAMMSHEIRTPLNGLVGFCDLLAREKLEGDSQDYVRNIQVCSDSLLSVINNVLNFSKLEAGKFQVSLVKTSLHDLLDEITLLFSSQVHEKGLTFKLSNSAPEFLETDGACLRQILINLIGNSLKLTEEGSIALIGNKVVDEVHLEVRDTGPGIAKEDFEKLFYSFVQLEHFDSRKIEGSGLGLSICSKLVKLLGGRIEVESELGNGACFRVVLPSNGGPESWYEEEKLENFRFVCEQVETRELLSKTFPQSCSLDNLEDVKLLNSFRILFDHEAYQSFTKDRRLYNKESNIIGVLTRQADSVGDKVVQLKSPWLLRDLKSFALGGVNKEKEEFARYESQTTEPSPSKARILVVDDVDTNRMIASAMLKKNGFDPVLASSGAECLDLCESELFDLILLDCQMPEMDGFETARKIRKMQSANSSIPVLAYTAHVREEEKRRCLEAGMTGLLLKPMKEKELIEALLSNLKN